MEVAKMETVFTAVTTGVEAGFDLVSRGMKRAASLTGTVTTGMARMGSSVLDTSLKLGGLGIAGLGAMSALAAKSPLLAPAFAKLDVATFQLSNSLARVLGPSIETVIGHFGEFVGWVEENEEPLSRVASSFLDAGESIAGTFVPALESIASWVTENPEIFEGLAAGIEGVGKGITEALGGGTVGEAVSELYGGGGEQRGFIEGGGMGVLGAGAEALGLTGGENILDNFMRVLKAGWSIQNSQQVRGYFLNNVADMIGEGGTS